MPGFPDALKDVEGLAFDVFGTVVDWRSSIEAALRDALRAKLESDDFAALSAQLQQRVRELTAEDSNWVGEFAQEWRNSYKHFTRTFNPATDPWKDIDTHHHDSLRALLAQHSLASSSSSTALFSPAETRALSLAWHRLRPWPDAVSGIRALNDNTLATASLSNGTRTLLADLDLPFRELVSAEDFGAYKPHPSTYRGVAARLGLPPGRVAMVAAHLNDLDAARAVGLRTVYVEREREEDWAEDDERYVAARGWVDMWVAIGEGGFEEVARRFAEG